MNTSDLFWSGLPGQLVIDKDNARAAFEGMLCEGTTGARIRAIKFIRYLTGMQLLDVKNLADAEAERLGAPKESCNTMAHWRLERDLKERNQQVAVLQGEIRDLATENMQLREQLKGAWEAVNEYTTFNGKNDAKMRAAVTLIEAGAIDEALAVLR